jgi:SPP1 gp7 family putative phage head morphogenesis protein
MPKVATRNSPRRSPHTVKREGAQVPNMDRGFWMPFGVGNPGISLSEVMSRPYQNHGYSYACGRAITFNISRLSHVYAEQSGDKEQPLGADNQLVQLFRRPNALMTEMQFWQAILLNLLFPIETSNLTARDGATLHGGMNQTGGTCFVIPWNGKTDAPAQLDKGEIPTELLPMGARFFSPILQNNKRGLTDVIGWNYKVPEQNGKAIPFKLNEILRIYLFNPYVWISGMAPFFAAQTAVDQDARATLMNTRFFENDATPGGILSTKENLRIEQARDIRKEFQQTYGGIGNSRKTAVLWGGMEYQKMQLDHQEMQWKEQKDANLEELLATFGLNKIAVGRYENLNFATIREGRRCLWHDTYIPLDELIWDAINNQWFKNIGKGVRGYSDYDKVYALQEELKPKAEMAAILVKDLAFSPTLACKKAGIKLTQEEIDKYPYLDEQLPRIQSAGGIPGENQSIDISNKASRVAVVRGMRELTKVQRDERNANYVKSVLDAGERNFLAILNRYFISQRNRTLDKVDEWTKKNTKGLIVKADYIDPRAFLLDQDKEFDLLMEIYHPAVKRQLELEKADLVSELGSLFSWDLTSDYVDHAVELRSDLLEGINTSTFEVASDAIAAAIKEGTDSGLTPQEMAKLIKQNVEDVYSVRTGKELKPHGEFDLGGMSSSTTIARTEMGSVASQARWDCYKQEGIEQQEWSTAEDDRVRESHMAVDGMKVKLGDVFGITGLRFPRDPLGDAGEVINCRCSVFAYWEA